MSRIHVAPRNAFGIEVGIRGVVTGPGIFRDGHIYDEHLDRFLLELPSLGAGAYSTQRAYAYDIAVFVRYLEQACGVSVWQATRQHLIGFRRVRLEGITGAEISEASWNRSIAAIQKLYEWGLDEALIDQLPFKYTAKIIRDPRTGRSMPLVTNQNKIRMGSGGEVKYLSASEYNIFRTVGLLNGGGASRARTSNRNVLFADLLVSTGVRLQEGGALLLAEMQAIAELRGDNQRPMKIPAGLGKGNKERSIRVPARVLKEILEYEQVERQLAEEKFRARRGWEKMKAPIMCRNIGPKRLEIKAESGDWNAVPIERLKPVHRLSLICCEGAGNVPVGPAALWVSEIGMPLQLNSWQVAFKRACERCEEAGFEIHAHPHKLRHTFAVHLLLLLRVRRAVLLERNLAGLRDSYGGITEDPQRTLQRVLGHSDVNTTEKYVGPANQLPDDLPEALAEFVELISRPGDHR